MASGKVVGIADKRASRECERQFLALLDNDIKSEPDNVRPMPADLFDRFEAIERRIAKARAEELMEG